MPEILIRECGHRSQYYTNRSRSWAPVGIFLGRARG